MRLAVQLALRRIRIRVSRLMRLIPASNCLVRLSKCIDHGIEKRISFDFHWHDPRLRPVAELDDNQIVFRRYIDELPVDSLGFEFATWEQSPLIAVSQGIALVKFAVANGVAISGRCRPHPFSGHMLYAIQFAAIRHHQSETAIVPE